MIMDSNILPPIKQYFTKYGIMSDILSTPC